LLKISIFAYISKKKNRFYNRRIDFLEKNCILPRLFSPAYGELCKTPLPRAERIDGNGVVFQRVNSNVLSCARPSFCKPSELVNGLINSALLSPKTGVFADFSTRKTKKRLAQWKPVQKPIMIELQVFRYFYFTKTSISTKIAILGKDFYFRRKFRILSKIFILEENFDS